MTVAAQPLGAQAHHRTGRAAGPHRTKHLLLIGTRSFPRTRCSNTSVAKNSAH